MLDPEWLMWIRLPKYSGTGFLFDPNTGLREQNYRNRALGRLLLCVCSAEFYKLPILDNQKGRIRSRIRARSCLGFCNKYPGPSDQSRKSWSNRKRIQNTGLNMLNNKPLLCYITYIIIIFGTVLYSTGSESTAAILADLVGREAGKGQGLPR